MTTAEPVIEIHQLTKDYEVGFLKKKTVRALDNLSLEVRRGEIFGFLGPNGAGKTTTLKLLMRLIYPSSGSARILGADIGDTSTRARIGYLPENPYFYDYLSGRELLLYSASLFGIPAAVARERATAVLKQVGLEEERASRQLRKYSKGMLQRIGIAQALINEPEVVFLDEPMSGLDPLGRREVRDLLVALRQQQKTVFFSSHILSDVEALCDRAAVLNRGRLIKCGAVQELAGSADETFELVVTGIAEASFQALSQALPQRLDITPSANGVHLTVQEECRLQETIAIIHHFGGKLLSLNPKRAPLEELFSTPPQKGEPL